MASGYVSNTYIRLQKCVVGQGDYFEGSVVIVDYNMAGTFCTLDN